VGPAQPTWAGLGWAGLGPANPARSLAQASGLARLSNTRALTHACCYTVQLTKTNARGRSRVPALLEAMEKLWLERWW